MRIARSEIVMPGDIVHMYWRCHNRSKLLSDRRVKEKIIELYFKYKDRFGVEIIDFQNMDNHSHWVLKAKDAKSLGDFARVVHSQIASFVNRLLDRDSQVIRERFSSPPVRDEKYCERLIGYVLTNRYKADRKTKPENDPFCSAYHRMNNTKFGKQLAKYSDIGLCESDENEAFLKRLLKFVLSKLPSEIEFFNSSNFLNQFAVGSNATIQRVSSDIRERFKMRSGFT